MMDQLKPSTQILRSGAYDIEPVQMSLEVATNEVKRLEEEKQQAQPPPKDKENEFPMKPPQIPTADSPELLRLPTISPRPQWTHLAPSKPSN